VSVVLGIPQTGVEIPNLAGQDMDEAEDRLRELGLSPQRADSADDNDRVSTTNPPAGQTVPRGSTVILQTGDSGDSIRMPNVEGLSEEQALDRLAEEGLQNLQTRQQRVSNPDQDGEVIEQSVQPGEQVNPGQQITLTIGQASGGGGQG
jgi:eukaryotic-like serine/threonine-protein kinase